MPHLDSRNDLKPDLQLNYLGEQGPPHVGKISLGLVEAMIHIESSYTSQFPFELLPM